MPPAFWRDCRTAKEVGMADFHEAGIFWRTGLRATASKFSESSTIKTIAIVEENFRRDGLGTIVTVNLRLVWPGPVA
jgi:hypothetical protein